jgi:hypothetical protein
MQVNNDPSPSHFLYSQKTFHNVDRVFKAGFGVGLFVISVAGFWKQQAIERVVLCAAGAATSAVSIVATYVHQQAYSYFDKKPYQPVPTDIPV